MKVLRIRNKGLVQAEDIMLIGSSTKRGETGKIGQFGSGWKYALAWLMRNNATPKIYAGLDRIKVTSKMVQHRNNIVSVISVNDKETSITTDMGMKWTGWMALRELISNAIDEGEEIVEVVESSAQIVLEEGYTNIFIPITPEIQEVMDKYEYYFAFEREPDWISPNGMLYIRSSNSEVNVYRKGIRCFDSIRKTRIDFNFNNIEITEDRLIEGGEGIFNTHARMLLKECDSIPCLKAAILSEYKDIHPDMPTKHYISAYKQLLDEGYKFTTKTFSRVLGIFADGIVIKDLHHKELVRLELISNPLEAVFKHLDFAFVRINDDGLSDQVVQILARFGEFKVFFGKMDTYSDIKVKGNEFYIRESVFEMLKNEPKRIAAACLKAHPNGDKLIAEIL